LAGGRYQFPQTDDVSFAALPGPELKRTGVVIGSRDQAGISAIGVETKNEEGKRGLRMNNITIAVCYHGRRYVRKTG
jgi:hypothetical protein